VTRQHDGDEVDRFPPAILPPTDDDVDPTPLIDTLARVALAIAERRAGQDSTQPAETLNTRSTCDTLDREGQRRVARGRRLLRLPRRRA
jgi:hypothetical protein